ncbi:MAG: T9SS type A sorting domain-containing protein [Emticicia sp.]|nr:T9SS type A sorting domain-containing protein [Emticicia sp.]
MKVTDYHVDNKVIANDRLWLNLVSDDFTNYKVMSTDGTPEGTAYFDKTDFPIDGIVSLFSHGNRTYIIAYKINSFGGNEYFFFTTHVVAQRVVIDYSQKLEKDRNGDYGFRFKLFNEKVYLYNSYINRIDEIFEDKPRPFYQLENPITDFIISKENKLFLFSFAGDLKITTKDRNITEEKLVKLDKQLSTSLINNLRFILSNDKIFCICGFKFITINTKTNEIVESLRDRFVCSVIDSDKGFWVSTTDSLFKDLRAVEIDSSANVLQEKKIPSLNLVYYKSPFLFSFRTSYSFADLIYLQDVISDKIKPFSFCCAKALFEFDNKVYVTNRYGGTTLEIDRENFKIIPKEIYPINKTNNLLSIGRDKEKTILFTRNPLRKDSVNFQYSFNKQQTNSANIRVFFDDKEHLYFEVNNTFYLTKGTSTSTKIIKQENGDTLNTYRFFIFKNAYYFITPNGLERANGEFTEILIADNKFYTDGYSVMPMGNSFLMMGLNRKSNTQSSFWVSNGTKLGTKSVMFNHTFTVESYLTLPLEDNLLILNPSDRSQLYVFDGAKFELLHKFEREIAFPFNQSNLSLGITTIGGVTTNGGAYYFKISNKDYDTHTIYRISADKSIAKLRTFYLPDNPNFFQIGENMLILDSWQRRESLLLLVDNSEIKVSRVNLEGQDIYPKITYPTFKKNSHYYATYQKDEQLLINTLKYHNVLFKIDKNLPNPVGVFQFTSYSNRTFEVFDDSLQSSLFFYGTTLSNSLLWRIDKNTDKVYQFVHNNDKLLYTKWLNNKLYLNLCKNGECHLYETDGTTDNTKKLTQKSLIIRDLYLFNNKLYAVADDGVYGFELWEIDKTNETKTDYKFEEVEMPKPNELESVIFTKDGEAISLSINQNRVYLYHFFPNPFYEDLKFLTDNESVLRINVLNNLGKIVKTFEGNENQINKYLSNYSPMLPKGNYLIQILSEYGQVTKRLIKE